jgi:hypothetical protein
MSILYVALLTGIVSLRPTYSKSFKNQNILKLNKYKQIDWNEQHLAD